MEFLETMKNVLILEAKALELAAARITEKDANVLTDFFKTLKERHGILYFCGVGKSGYIAQKLASTFSSLGQPSFFLHPSEAMHGDLGRLSEVDHVIFISKSGTTEEILKIIPFLPFGVENCLGLLGEKNSPIGDKCNHVFDCSVEKEACLNNQAPTTSSTLAMAMGDAIAVMYEKYIGLSKEGFAKFHPGGILGKSMRLKVSDVMLKADDCAKASPSQSLKEILIEMTRLPVGGCAVVEGEALKGILVEGDVRRTLTSKETGLETLASEIMTTNPVKVTPDALASEAFSLMEGHKPNPLNILPVVSSEGAFCGFIRLHDLFKEGFN
ncbi:MAG: hypothetical protein CME70_10135 [Halobacteriovorax sp.]|nr:hypothetical protein [Halobacteriovorax sp.]